MRIMRAADSVPEHGLHELYRYPTDLDRPWVRLNFVSSIDGVVTVDGRAAALGTDADRLVFAVLRDLADVVLVGAGTVRAENYGGVQATADRPRPARLAVVTTSGALDPGSRMFTGAVTAPLILASSPAAAANGQAWENAGAEVVDAGPGPVSGPAILDALARRQLYRVLCEGGPRLAGQLADGDHVDEVCLTTSPLLASGDAGRITKSHKGIHTKMWLGQLLQADDGTLLARWVRAGAPGPA